jgi:hypothetical protein
MVADECAVEWIAALLFCFAAFVASSEVGKKQVLRFAHDKFDLG